MSRKRRRLTDLRRAEFLEARCLLACDINPLAEITPPETTPDVGHFSDLRMTVTFGDVTGEVTQGSTISMGTFPWGEQGTMELTIENLPGENEEISITRLITPSGFRVGSPISRVVPDGESATANIIYDSWSPSDCGLLMLRIEAGDESRFFMMELKARHPNAEVVVMLDGQEIESGEMIDFGDVPLDTSTTRTLMVKNVGDLELRLTQINATPTFSSQKSGVIVVPPSEEVEVELPLDFAALVPGPNLGDFEFGTNDLDDQKFELGLVANVTGALPPPSGDFNGDGVADVVDLELLQIALAEESADTKFDLDVDGDVDEQDFDQMINEILDVLPGDANLDGTVDVRDFLLLSRNFNKTDAVWSDGNFNTDGIVNVQDFLRLSQNFGRSAQG